MIDELPNLYREYCELQTSEHNIEQSIAAIHRITSVFCTDFPADMNSYRELNDRLYGIWKDYLGKSVSENQRMFATAGSTRNGKRHYKFGPHPDHWIQAIWELTRMPLGWRTIVKLDSHMNHNAPLTIAADPNGIYQHLISCGPFHQQLTLDLIELLRQLLSEYPAVSLISVPDSFLYLNRQPAFKEFVT